jgi:sporulation protein YlmC with PRC-barrel domain
MKAIYGFLAAGLVGTSAWAQDSKIAEGENAGVPVKVEKAQGKDEAQVAPKVGEIEKSREGKSENKSLIGKVVVDEKGREIGRVQDLVMNMEKGELGYVVLQVKGDEGDEELKLPVPVKALKPREDGQKLVLNVSENVLAALEVYRDEELPAPDAFSVDTAVGGAAGSETASGQSESESGAKNEPEAKPAKESAPEKEK